MRYYFAPLEGITGYVYRNLQAKHFAPADFYVTPFISPNQMRTIRPSDLADILPEHNEGLRVIPQLIGNRSDELIDTAMQIRDLGYDEINLNLGCPSGTVVAKGKGSGLLRDLDRLEAFLTEVYDGLDGRMKMSVKTRIGVNSDDEWEKMVEIFNRFPIEMLTVHCRIRKEFYKGTPHLDAFELALQKSKNPLCYNGDIFSKEAEMLLLSRFPQTDNIMLGRGIIANPALIEELKGTGCLTKERMRDFLRDVMDTYKQVYTSDGVVLNKMKELWNYMIWSFDGADGYQKEIGKSKSLPEYQGVVNSLMAQCGISTQRNTLV